MNDKRHHNDFYQEGATTYLPIRVPVNAPAAVVWQVFGESFGSFLAMVAGFSKVSCDIADGRSPTAGDSLFYTVFGLPGQKKLKVFDPHP